MTTLADAQPATARAAQPPAWLRLRMLWVYLTLVALFIGPASSVLDGVLDLWWTVLSGRWIVEHRALPVPDPFTSAPHTAVQVDAQWIAQLVFYAAYRLGGLASIIFVDAAAVTVTFGFLLAASYVVSRHVRLSCGATLFGYCAAATNLAARAQVLAYAIFAVYLLVIALARYRGKTRLLWVLPPVTAIWANTHGSFFLGPFVLGCATLDTLVATRSWRATRPYVLVLAASVLAMCATPYGSGSVTYVLTLTSNPVVRDFITEWAPTSLNVGATAYVFFPLLAALAGLLLVARTRPTLGEWLTLAVFTYLALSSVRAIAWWGVALAPIIARLLGSLAAAHPSSSQQREKVVLNGAILVVVGCLAVVSLPWLRSANPLFPPDRRGFVADDRPDGMVAFLQDHSYAGKVFDYQGWAGYLDWSLWPKNQPFVDGRVEIFPASVWLDYFGISYPQTDWQALLDKYAIGSLVLSAKDNGALIDVLSKSPEWQQVYADEQGAVFARTTPLS